MRRPQRSCFAWIRIEKVRFASPGSPRGGSAAACGRDRCPADAEEDLLCQIAGNLGAPDRPAEIPEQLGVIGGEERFGVGHASLFLRTSRTADPRTDIFTLFEPQRGEGVAHSLDLRVGHPPELPTAAVV